MSQRKLLATVTNADGVLATVDEILPARPTKARVAGRRLDLLLEGNHPPLACTVGETAARALANGSPLGVCEADETGPAFFRAVDVERVS